MGSCCVCAAHMLTHCLLLWQELEEVKALKDSVQVLLDEAIIREVNHLRWNFVYTKHNRALGTALCDAQRQEAKSAQQLSAAKQTIKDLAHELQVCFL